MSLFGSIQLGGNTLGAMQIGLQVVGNNIANANTPDYVRQEAIYAPSPVQKNGSLIEGTGVTVDSIVQRLDNFVQERLIGAHSDRAGAAVQEQSYRDLEVLLNELSSNSDLSSSFGGFFNAIDEVMKDPGNAATRNLVVGKGVALTDEFHNLQSRGATLQQELDQRVTADASEINNLAEQVRQLNIQIATTEGGGSSGSDAAGLRVRRQTAIDRLSELVNIHVDEQPSGGDAISIGGEFLVFEGQRRQVEVGANAGGGSTGAVQFADTHAPLSVTSGELQGLYTARDGILQGFLNRLDGLAGTLAFEFNKLYSQGQGLDGFQDLTSAESVQDPNAALDAAGLKFTPASGVFNVLIHNKTDGSTQTHEIQIHLNGLDEDTTLNSLAQQLNAVPGLTAAVTATGGLHLATDSKDTEFAFSGDTSGTLAALGLNTFFTGDTAARLGVNDEVKGINNAGKFAASLGGIGNDSAGAEQLANFFDRPLEAAGNSSLSDVYNQLLNEVTQGSSVAKSTAEGYRVFEGTLQGQSQAVSGVSIDEEAIKMITLQRIYQASAKYIQTVSGLLDDIVKI